MAMGRSWNGLVCFSFFCFSSFSFLLPLFPAVNEKSYCTNSLLVIILIAAEIVVALVNIAVDLWVGI